jgi:hypothetical protein
MTLKLTYGGFNYVADVDGSYTDATSLQNMLSETSSNSVALTADYGIDAANNTVYADYSAGGTTGSTESIADLTAEAQAAEAKGLSVMIRPLIDFLPGASTATLTGNGNTYADGDWRAYYNPGSTAQGIAFLQSYETTVLLPLATMAQQVGAQVFDIGTEIDQLTGPAYQAEWNQIITDVKAIYTGKLTYSAIGDNDLSPWQYANFADPKITTPPPVGTGDATTQVSFWNKLDYLGIDQYSALSNLNDTGNNGSQPSLQALINAWEQPFTNSGQGTPTDNTAAQTGGLSLIQYYESLATATGKPLLFTEIGYNSAPDAASQPFFTSSSAYDPALQASLYQAFFQAWQAAGNTSLQGVWFWNWEPDPNTVGAGTDPSWTPQGNTAALNNINTAFSQDETQCYAAGTRILTIAGEMPVEELRTGDLVLTASGAVRPIVWIGRGKVLATRGRRNAATPIIVRKGALGDNVPHRDLCVTKGHSIFLDDVLIPVECLVNHRSIRWDDRAQEVAIFHIELPTHDVLLANGAPAESYRDDGNRWLFQNANSGWDLGPQAPCAPVLTGGPIVDAVWRRLLDRAGPRPTLPMTDDPDLHLLADRQRINPTIAVGNWRVFRLPGKPQELRVVSRAVIPQEHWLARDARSLGVAMQKIVLSHGPRIAVIEADDPRLVDGFHSFEPENVIRWTDGNARLPGELFDDFSGPVTLELLIGGATNYPLLDRVRREAA